MSVEAPSAPRTAERSRLGELSTEELLAELERRKDSETLANDSSPETSYPSNSGEEMDDEVENEEVEPSYYGPNDPEKAADDRNRAIDHEILGKTVRFRQDINSKATEAVSRVDLLFSKAKNMVGKPRAAIRRWHMDRAEKSLGKKESRLEEKQQAWQAKLDATSSGRLQERRQEKATKAIQKEQAKIDSYKTNHVERRQEMYHETVATHNERLEKSTVRQAERKINIAESRQAAIDRKAVAQGKKELRTRLRGPENNAGRRETRQIMNEILGQETANQKLRQLGYDVIGRQLSESELAKNKPEQASAEQVVTILTRAIAREQDRQEALRLKIEKGKRDYVRINKVLGDTADLNKTFNELESVKGSDSNIFTIKGMRGVARTIQDDENMLEGSRRRATELEKQLTSADMRLASQDRRSIPAEHMVVSESENVDKQVHDILR